MSVCFGGDAPVCFHTRVAENRVPNDDPVTVSRRSQVGNNSDTSGGRTRQPEETRTSLSLSQQVMKYISNQITVFNTFTFGKFE